LKAAGLITRENNERTRREITVQLSRDGRDLLAQLERRRRQHLEEVAGVMSPADRAAVGQGLVLFSTPPDPCPSGDGRRR